MLNVLKRRMKVQLEVMGLLSLDLFINPYDSTTPAQPLRTIIIRLK